MIPMPTLWHYFTQRWLTLEPDLARAWWFALAHARWTTSAAWRDAFLAFDRQDGTVTRDFVTAFFEETCTLPQLIQLLEQLQQERVLLKREGHRIEEALFSQADGAGQWHHTRKGVASGRT